MKEIYRPTRAEINIDNLKSNFDNIRALLKKETKLCAIIKANGYGHGAVRLAKIYEEQGADYFGVATCEEALELRQAGIKTPVMCLGYVPENRFEDMIENHIDITLYSVEKALLLSEKAVKSEKKANIHIKLDSGMSRLGFQCNDETVDAIMAISRLDKINIIGVFTHFALADDKSPDYTIKQFENYMRVVSALEEKGLEIPIKHVCNSAGVMMFPDYHLDMVRPGIILYGHYPSEDVDKSVIELRPAMALKTEISHVKELEEGRGVSYGHKYITGSNEVIATLPVGYADGFTRMLSGKADVMIDGRIVPVVGRICMDQSMIKVDGSAKAGDQVTIFSDQPGLAIERFADSLDTINYELLCMVQRRVPRVYLEKGEITGIEDYLIHNEK